MPSTRKIDETVPLSRSIDKKAGEEYSSKERARHSEVEKALLIYYKLKGQEHVSSFIYFNQFA